MDHPPKSVPVKDFYIGPGHPLTVMSGPCVIESEEHCLRCAEALAKMFESSTLSLIFKTSYDKANRSSVSSFRGPGPEEGLRILERVKKETGLPVVTDVHNPQEVEAAAAVCDIIQIPAFLCRQTDLIVAAGHTGRPINVKKGQFMAPWDMKNVTEKIASTGNTNIILTDRGTSFGYNNLVSDMRAIPIMQDLGYPVCFDASHSVQLPGAQGTQSGGQRQFIAVLAKSAVAAGALSLYIESHPDPSQAKCDSATVMPYEALEKLIGEVEKIYEAVHTHASTPATPA